MYEWDDKPIISDTDNTGDSTPYESQSEADSDTTFNIGLTDTRAQLSSVSAALTGRRGMTPKIKNTKGKGKIPDDKLDSGSSGDKPDTTEDNETGDGGDGDGDEPGGGGGGNSGDDNNNDDEENRNSEAPDTAHQTLDRDVMLLHLQSKVLSAVERIANKKDFEVKCKEPDTFDGKNPALLKPFLTQLLINLRTRSKAFRSNQSRVVAWAISYLRGPALQYFQVALLDPDTQQNLPSWSTNLKLFVRQMVTLFGPYDIQAEAEEALRLSEMKSESRLMEHLLTFQENAVLSGWNDRALYSQFYKSLPDRIKDELIRFTTRDYRQLRAAALEIDSRYHQRRSEKEREAKKVARAINPADKYVKPSSSSNRFNSGSRTFSGFGPSQAFKAFHKHPTGGNSGSATGSGKPFRPNPSNSSKDISHLLGKDGKLNTTERERRMKAGLCTYCGNPGHFASDCKKAKFAKGKASSSKSSGPPPGPSSAPSAKKL